MKHSNKNVFITFDSVCFIEFDSKITNPTYNSVKVSENECLTQLVISQISPKQNVFFDIIFKQYRKWKLQQ